MVERDKRALAPPDGSPILPWYEGAFSRAFVALHPFFTVEGLDPASCEHGTLVLPAGDKPDGLSLADWLGRERTERLHGKELSSTSVQDVAKRFGEPIRSSAICRQLGFADHTVLDRALRTHIGGLRDEFSDLGAAERLIQHCAWSKMFLPTEGSFQPVMETPLAEALISLGLTDVLAGDEFGDEVRRVSVEELGRRENWNIARRGNIFTEDRTLLITTPWDSFFTVIMGTSDQRLDLFSDVLEGFWCTRETTTDWCLEPTIPLAG
jgi:hypothetical protein